MSADLLPRLRPDRQVVLAVQNPSGLYTILRLNHLHPPFSNRGIPHALLGMIAQSDCVALQTGSDPSLGRTGVGFFCPSSPMASDAGIEVLTGPRDLDRVRREIVEAGYKGERVVTMAAGDIEDNKNRTELVVDLMRKVGLEVDMQVSDWGTMMQRVFKKEPIEQGGWNCLTYGVHGTDVWDPAMNNYLRSNGADARPGWPSSSRIEELRNAWLNASDVAARRRIARDLQVQAFQDVPYIPLGLYLQNTAYRNDLTGALQGFPIFWNVHRRD